MTAPAPALEYARPVTPEGFLVRRTPSVVVVSAVPTARRILRATRGFTVTVLVVAAWVAPAVYFQPTGGLPPLWALIIPGLFLLLAAWLLFEQLVWVLDPVRWELDATRLLMVSRRLTGVAREELPRAALGALRVEKLRLKGRVFKSLHLVASTPGGFQVAIASGTRRELEALRGILAEALGIPTDPGGEAAYPPRRPAGDAGGRVDDARPAGRVVARRPHGPGRCCWRRRWRSNTSPLFAARRATGRRRRRARGRSPASP